MVKAHNTLLPSGSVERLHAQDRLMRHLRKEVRRPYSLTGGYLLFAQGLPVPDVLCRDGCSTFPIKSGLVRVLTFLEGEILKCLGTELAPAQ